MVYGSRRLVNVNCTMYILLIEHTRTSVLVTDVCTTNSKCKSAAVSHETKGIKRSMQRQRRAAGGLTEILERCAAQSFSSTRSFEMTASFSPSALRSAASSSASDLMRACSAAHSCRRRSNCERSRRAHSLLTPVVNNSQTFDNQTCIQLKMIVSYEYAYIQI